MTIQVLILLCTFVAGFLLIFGINLVVTDVHRSDQQERRIEMLNEVRSQLQVRAKESVAHNAGLAELAAEAHRETIAERPTINEQLQAMLWQAGMRTPPEKFLMSTGIAGVSVGAVVGVVTLNPVITVISAGIVVAIPFLVVQFKRKQRLELLLSQLPDGFELMSRVLRAGQSISQSMHSVSQECSAPISEEFGYCYEQQNLGLNPEFALRDLSKRTGLLEIKVFVLAMIINRQTGGNLTELLDKLSKVVRDRYRMRGKVKGLTAEGRMQGVILMMLPIGVYGILLISNRSYAIKLFEHPWLIMGTLGWMGIGGLWIRKIVNFDF